MSILLLLNVLGIGFACAAIFMLFVFARRRAAQLEVNATLGTMELQESTSQRYALNQAA